MDDKRFSRITKEETGIVRNSLKNRTTEKEKNYKQYKILNNTFGIFEKTNQRKISIQILLIHTNMISKNVGCYERNYWKKSHQCLSCQFYHDEKQRNIRQKKRLRKCLIIILLISVLT